MAVTPPSRYGERWSALASTRRRARPRELLSVCVGDSVIVAGAHPDDETLGIGAGIAELVADGVEVHVVCASDGEAALSHVGLDIPDLAQRRVAELREAMLTLGVASVTVPGLPDGRLSEHEDDLVDVLVSAVRALGARHLLTVWWEDPHPDHAAIGRAALRAAEETGCDVSGYPVWAPHWSDPQLLPTEHDVLTVLTCSAEARAGKAAALASYVSQTEPSTGFVEAVLPRAVVEWPLEMLVRR